MKKVIKIIIISIFVLSAVTLGLKLIFQLVGEEPAPTPTPTPTPVVTPTPTPVVAPTPTPVQPALRSEPAVEWTKSFGQAKAPELARAVQQTADGGYILVGSTTPPGARNAQVYLIKTDSAGNLLWEKTLGGEKDDGGFAVQQTSDGGYIVAGSTGGSGKPSLTEDTFNTDDVYLVKTDALGNVQWEKTFGGAKADRAQGVQQTSDGGYILVGMTYSFGAGQSDIYLIKTDAAGNKVWEKTFGKGQMDWGYSVQQTSDGGYVLVGIIPVGFGRLSPQGKHTQIVNIYVVKTDSAGRLLWEKSFGGEGNDVRGHSVKVTPDGNYIIAGTIDVSAKNENDCYLLKIDATGKMVWDKSIGVPDRREWCYEVDVTADGGYVLAGETQIGPLGEEADLNVFVARTDATGTVLWTKEIVGGTGSHVNDWVRGVQHTSDGGYILAGMKTSADGNKDIFLIKLAKDQFVGGEELALPEPSPSPSESPSAETWILKGYTLGKLAGNEIDSNVVMADVLLLDSGIYRLYYAAAYKSKFYDGEEVIGGSSSIKYAESVDGITWEVKGTILSSTSDVNSREYVVSAPSLLKLSDGRYRLYYQASPKQEPGQEPKLHIRSAISTDGITFTREAGVRIELNDYDSNSPLRLAGHGTYFRASDGTIVGIFSGDFTTEVGASDLKMAISTDEGVTFNNLTTLYQDWHDPIVIKVANGFRLYATYLREKQGTAFSPDGKTWPSQMTEVNFVDENFTKLTAANAGVGDIGGVLLPSGQIRLYTNYGAPSNIVYFEK